MTLIHKRLCMQPLFAQLPWPRLPERMMLISLNWLGDVVMAIPAVTAYRRAFPDVKITVLTRPPFDAIWSLCAAVDEVKIVSREFSAMKKIAKREDLREYDTACVLPHSFRAALIPWMAGIPQRRGVGGGVRSLLLNDILPRWSPDGVHQSWEILRLIGLRPDDMGDMLPSLAVDHAEANETADRFGMKAGSRVALLPGAARGGVKRWPAEHFVSLAQLLQRSRKTAFAVMGTEAERTYCEAIASEIGGDTVCLAGATSLRELTLLLASCRAVVCNDSGGMHLAAAAGTPLVAVYGITDPQKTGPLGRYSRVVSLPGARHRRDVPRESREADRVLAAITPSSVAAEVDLLLKDSADE